MLGGRDEKGGGAGNVEPGRGKKGRSIWRRKSGGGKRRVWAAQGA